MRCDIRPASVVIRAALLVSLVAGSRAVGQTRPTAPSAPDLEANRLVKTAPYDAPEGSAISEWGMAQSTDGQQVAVFRDRAGVFSAGRRPRR